MSEHTPGPWDNCQRRYVNYCLAHGAASGDEMLERDRARWPGGVMCGYSLWINEQWSMWKRETKWSAAILSQEDHDAFDAWLSQSACSLQARIDELVSLLAEAADHSDKMISSHGGARSERGDALYRRARTAIAKATGATPAEADRPANK